jgi:hypothetical protein
VPLGGVVGQIVAALASPAQQVGLFDEHRPGARSAAGAATCAVEQLTGLGVAGRVARSHELGIERHVGHRSDSWRFFNRGGADVKLC